MLISYHVHPAGELVTDPKAIRSHYMRTLFIVDFISVFPFNEVVLLAIGNDKDIGNTTHFIALLQLLGVLRMYRIVVFFRQLEYNLTVRYPSIQPYGNVAYSIHLYRGLLCKYLR